MNMCYYELIPSKPRVAGKGSSLMAPTTWIREEGGGNCSEFFSTNLRHGTMAFNNTMADNYWSLKLPRKNVMRYGIHSSVDHSQRAKPSQYKLRVFLFYGDTFQS